VSEGEGIIDSEVAAMMLKVSPDALRMLVYRKKIVPVGRQKRKSLFFLADVLALQTRREQGKGNTSVT
jgi:hypothetical protein